MNLPTVNRFHRRLCAACLALVLAAPSVSPAQAILENEVVEPRTFGYTIGDHVRREVHLTLREGFRLDPESLPEPGRLDRWLELAAPELRTEQGKDGIEYRLVLTYLLTNAPAAPETVTIPQQDLRLAGESYDVTTLVPALRIEVSPLTSGIRPDRLNGGSLQQDREPLSLPLERRQVRLTWSAALLLALAAFFMWRRGATAFLTRRKLPFATAVRELQRLPPGEDAAALKVAHRAINRTAGRVVFAHNLDDFLAEHAAFRGLRDEFRELFDASGKVFFDEGSVGPERADTASVLRLCRQCRNIEKRITGARPPGRLHAARN